MDNSLAPAPEATESRSPKTTAEDQPGEDLGLRTTAGRNQALRRRGGDWIGVSAVSGCYPSLPGRGLAGRAFGSGCREKDPDAEAHRHGSRRVPASGDYREDSRPPPVWRMRKRLAATRSPVFCAVTSASG